MLWEAQNASDAPDPTPFHETELFKECRRLGIIPGSEADLVLPPSPPANAADPDPPGGPDAAPELLDLSLQVEGMWCPACAWLIDETLKTLPGVVSPVTRFSTDTFQCRYHPVRTSPDEIARHIRRLGYRPADGPGDSSPEHRREVCRFALSAVFAMNVMMLSFALYSGFFTRLSRESVQYLSWPIFLMASVPFFYGGWRIHRRAWAGLRARVLPMETLISTASGSAYFYSVFNLVQGSIHLYFDTAAMLITLTLLGKLLERSAKDRVLRNLSAFFALTPTKVRLVTDTHPRGRYAAAAALRKGDLFIVEAGEIVSADGVVMDGRGRVDEASLTGEAVPVPKRPGDPLHAGTTVVQGVFRVRARAVGEDSTLGRMQRILQRSLSEKTPFEGRTDRLLVVFVPLILGLAAATGLFCWARGMGVEASLVRAITVMVISCPCALGIAIPLARVAGISAAGSRGILVREFSSFERAGRVSAVIFDKTGTLTEGSHALREVAAFPPFGRREALALAAGLEEASEHYLAAEIRRVCEREGIVPERVTSLKAHDNGVSGTWNGAAVRIGARDFVPGARRREPAPDLAADADELSRVYLAREGRLAAVFLFGDRIREGSTGAVRELRRRGLRVALVSGDEPRTTLAIGRRVGIAECAGGVLPSGKAAFIRDLGKAGEGTAMVGDGINDAPALAAADLSIAVYSGPGLGREAADLTLMNSDPRQVPAFLDLAGKVNRKILQNLICSAAYNLLSIPVAMAGLLTPLVAVTAMLLSSLTVIGNTLLLIRRA